MVIKKPTKNEDNKRHSSKPVLRMRSAWQELEGVRSDAGSSEFSPKNFVGNSRPVYESAKSDSAVKISKPSITVATKKEPCAETVIINSGIGIKDNGLLLKNEVENTKIEEESNV